MVKWYKNLYFTEGTKKRKRKILHNLKHNKLQINVYTIVLPLGDSGLLEIYPSYVLLQGIYKEKKIHLVGLAQDLNDAYELVEKIVMDCYKSTNGFDIKSFVAERQVDVS